MGNLFSYLLFIPILATALISVNRKLQSYRKMRKAECFVSILETASSESPFVAIEIKKMKLRRLRSARRTEQEKVIDIDRANRSIFVPFVIFVMKIFFLKNYIYQSFAL